GAAANPAGYVLRRDRGHPGAGVATRRDGLSRGGTVVGARLLIAAVQEPACHWSDTITITRREDRSAPFQACAWLWRSVQTGVLRSGRAVGVLIVPRMGATQHGAALARFGTPGRMARSLACRKWRS